MKYLLTLLVPILLLLIAVPLFYAAVLVNWSSVVYLHWATDADFANMEPVSRASSILDSVPVLSREEALAERVESWTYLTEQIDSLLSLASSANDENWGACSGNGLIQNIQVASIDGVTASLRATTHVLLTGTVGDLDVSPESSESGHVDADAVGNAISPLQGWRCSGTQAVWAGEIENLVWAGEDLPRFSEGIGSFFTSGPLTSQLVDVSVNHIARVDRDGATTTVFALENTASATNAIFSPRLSVASGKTYILSALTKSMAGESRAEVGVACTSRDDRKNIIYHYAFNDRAPQEWTRASVIFSLEEPVTDCVVFLRNIGDASKVYFDEVLLFAVPVALDE